MFGTMVICLASYHEGGDLVLTHEALARAYLTARYDFGPWYLDLTHEVREATRGFRLV